MKSRSPSATYGIAFSNDPNASAAMPTKSRPAIGIRNWKKANVPEIRNRLPRFISGSASPLARETENASIASPAPSRALLKKNKKSHIKTLANHARVNKRNKRADRRIAKDVILKSRNLKQARSNESQPLCRRFRSSGDVDLLRLSSDTITCVQALTTPYR